MYPILDIIDTLLKGVDHFRSMGLIYPAAMAFGIIALLIGARSTDERVQTVIAVFMFACLGLGMMNALAAVE